MFSIKVYRLSNRLLSTSDAVNLTAWASESLDAGAKYLAVDMQNVSFMDSRGLGALILIYNRVEKVGATLGLCGISGQAGMLLDLTSMKDRFKLYDSVPEFEQATRGLTNTAVI